MCPREPANLREPSHSIIDGGVLEYAGYRPDHVLLDDNRVPRFDETPGRSLARGPSWVSPPGGEFLIGHFVVGPVNRCPAIVSIAGIERRKPYEHPL